MLPYSRGLPAKKRAGADFLPVAWATCFADETDPGFETLMSQLQVSLLRISISG